MRSNDDLPHSSNAMNDEQPFRLVSVRDGILECAAQVLHVGEEFASSLSWSSMEMTFRFPQFVRARST